MVSGAVQTYSGLSRWRALRLPFAGVPGVRCVTAFSHTHDSGWSGAGAMPRLPLLCLSHTTPFAACRLRTALTPPRLLPYHTPLKEKEGRAYAARCCGSRWKSMLHSHCRAAPFLPFGCLNSLFADLAPSLLHGWIFMDFRRFWMAHTGLAAVLALPLLHRTHLYLSTHACARCLSPYYLLHHTTAAGLHSTPRATAAFAHLSLPTTTYTCALTRACFHTVPLSRFVSPHTSLVCCRIFFSDHYNILSARSPSRINLCFHKLITMP